MNKRVGKSSVKGFPPALKVAGDAMLENVKKMKEQKAIKKAEERKLRREKASG